ncbi:hypothetical protein [Streptomyces sp. NPDC008001]|uniref:hypothetical protein n=1 Tax=Streptomyces sp. NPDC008001 TaxID=3364804 RepID=UPI0036F02943
MPAGTKDRTPHAVQTGLPWWGLALAAAAFLTFFALLASPASADPGPEAAGPGTVARVVAYVQLVLGELAA